MLNIHFHLSMSITVIGIVNIFAKDLMIERVIESQREDLVENLKDLSFVVGGVNLDSNIVKNVLNVIEICLIERIHSFDFHSALINCNFVYVFAGRKYPAKKTLTKVKGFVVSDGIRKN